MRRWLVLLVVVLLWLHRFVVGRVAPVPVVAAVRCCVAVAVDVVTCCLFLDVDDGEAEAVA